MDTVKVIHVSDVSNHAKSRDFFMRLSKTKMACMKNSGVFGAEFKLNFTSGGEIMRKSHFLLLLILCNGNLNEQLFSFMRSIVDVVLFLRRKWLRITCLRCLFSIP